MSITARTHNSFSAISRDQWRRLETRENPFQSWRFLNALEESGSVTAESGWQPNHLCLYDGERLIACAPSYLKFNSRGEFVFDWAWADAYQRHGLNYYPKLLTAVPWSPVTGPRLLVESGRKDATEIRQRLIAAALGCCESRELSSWHSNFLHQSDLEAFDSMPTTQAEQILPRSDWQFHWVNQGYGCFDEFLSSLRAKKRKNVRHERRDVAAAGIEFSRLHGNDLTPRDIDFIYSCYQQTFYEHGNHAALQRAFFEQIAASMGERLMVVIGRADGERVAMALFLQGGNRLYGRYWGAVVRASGLHFETAYYQGIEYCIERGIGVFESGAQGEHKISRGFTPVRTHSRHLIMRPDFRAAIAQFLDREQQWLSDYRSVLSAHTPYANRVEPEGPQDD